MHHACTIEDETRYRGHKAAALAGEAADPSWLTREDEVPEPCAMCDAARVRREALGRGEVLPFYVVAYGIERRYGGPEEGGWYQDWLSVLEIRKVWTFRQGLRVVRELRDKHPTCARGRSSVIGGEDTYVKVFYTPEMFPEETTERVRYE